MPSNRPDNAELFAAVSGFLKDDVLPKLTGSEAYHLRVAMNALSILEREAATAPQLDSAEAERLSALLGTTGTRDELNHALCEGIRAGKLTYRDARLMDHLTKTTMGKMSIDNPKYATYVQALRK